MGVCNLGKKHEGRGAGDPVRVKSSESEEGVIRYFK